MSGPGCQKRKGATVNFGGSLIFVEDLPGALAAVLGVARPARLALSSRVSLHAHCAAHQAALSDAEAGLSLLPSIRSQSEG